MGRKLALILLLAPLCAMADWLGELPAHGTVLSGFSDPDSVAATMAELPLCPAEGIWQMAADGATFAIVREDDASEPMPRRLRMVMVDSPNRRVRPGTVIGHAVPTVKPGVYEAKLYTKIRELGGLDVPRKFLLTVGKDDSTLTMQPFKSPVKLNLLRLIPYMYRAVHLQQSRPDGLDGAVRIYPYVPNPLTKTYL